ncbi:AdoMet_MTases domain containing protein [uncultured Caudovirales phage]|uniref:AdoMet_MTases domain containing protein n=1 Tax=uncultured Caudovirales phage TaxID=2100421 RepID=A0A6J7WK94_9CAUD|nr:AdoMet_MTases domain containing protein [uncultured Caudovirales phage]
MTKDVWLNANKDDAGDLILTGYEGEFKDMPVYQEIINLVGSCDKVLDFGCGVGRNTIALSNMANLVYGFDLPSMISLVPEENKSENIVYATDWDSVRELNFDCVLASLVFQHIDDEELKNYLYDLSKMTSKLVLHSRTWVDHTETKVLDIVEKYFIAEYIEYTRDPNNPIDDHFIATLAPRR